MESCLFLLGIGLFLFYNSILWLFPIEKKAIYRNRERAEEFAYSKKNFSTVLVGSGLIGGFSAKTLQRPGLFNLYFPYCGSCTGIEIIVLSNRIPHTLLVETNYIFKGFDSKLTKKLFKPGFYRARFYLPAMLEKNRVDSVLKEIFKPTKPIHITQNKLAGALYANAYNKYKDSYNKLPEDAQFGNDLKKLKKYVDYISARGCNIIFFEMPVEHELIDSPLALFQRNALKSIFGSEKYKWVFPCRSDEYETEDGIHLIEDSVYRYYKYLDKKCDNILSGSK